MRFISTLIVSCFIATSASAGNDAIKLGDLIWYNHNEEAIALLKKKPELVNAYLGDFAGLHLAAIRGNVTMTKYLLENGANPNQIDFDRCTPLVRAVDNEAKEVAKLLKAAGGKNNAISQATDDNSAVCK